MVNILGLVKPSTAHPVLPIHLFGGSSGQRSYCERIVELAGCMLGDEKSPLRLEIRASEVVITAASSGQTKNFPIPMRAARMARSLYAAVGALHESKPVAIGRFVFDPMAMLLQKEGNPHPIKLTEKEAALLSFFLAHGVDQPVTRQQILDYVWAYAPDVETHTLETHMYRLRQKLEDNPSQPQILVTEGSGYRLVIRSPMGERA